MVENLTLSAYAFLSSGLLTAGLLGVLLRTAMATASVDNPNHRSLHAHPTPRVGGIAMLLATAVTMCIWPPAGLLQNIFVIAAVLAAVSALDDRLNLPVLVRFTAHLIAAGIAVWSWHHEGASQSNGGTSMGIVSAAFLLLAICWMTNLFNFMDGANGLAGGMAAIGFGTYAVAATMAQEPRTEIALASATLAGAACGFLPFNFPNAKTFMGDAGAIPLGFLAAAIAVHGYFVGTWPGWFGPLVFSPFIVDATTTLVRRLIKRERVWQAHRDHYYQRLILSGWGHQKTVTTYYFLMLGSALSALISLNGELTYPVGLFWVITYVLLISSMEWRFHQENNDKSKKTPGAK